MTTSGNVVSSSGPYTDLGPTQIRIVEVLPGHFYDPIELKLKVVDVVDRPVYDALSYVWNLTAGSFDTQTPLNKAKVVAHAIFFMPLGANLEAAIRHLREKGSTPSAVRVLWIDALCINQSNSAERNHQVGLMKNIYSSARQVLIWLGPACQGSDYVLRVLRDGRLRQERSLRLFPALRNVVSSKWFRRVWAQNIQELALAHYDPVVHMGHESINWSTFVRAIRQMGPWSHGEVEEGTIRFGRREAPFRNTVEEGLSTAIRRICLPVIELASVRDDGPNVPFGVQLFRTIRSEASDPRDKVFGILGLSSFKDDDCAITADYNMSVFQVSLQASIAIMKDLFASYIEFQPWLKPSWPDPRYPSWLLDMKRFQLCHRPRSYTALYQRELTDVLKRGNGVTPIIGFSNDKSKLLTAGIPLGRVVAFDDVGQNVRSYFNPTPFLPNLRRELRSIVIEVSTEKVLSVLLGPYNTEVYNHDKVLADIEALLSDNVRQLPPHYRAFLKAKYEDGGQVFLTDAGHVGVCYCKSEGCKDDGTFVAAALFGIQLPFILKRVNKGYKLWALAHIDGHTLGDKHVEAMGPNDDWRDLVRDGKMEEYSIV